MKKIIALMMCIIMIFSTTACGKTSNEKYCSNCGKAVTKEAAYCGNCGEPIHMDKKVNSEDEDVTSNDVDNSIVANNTTQQNNSNENTSTTNTDKNNNITNSTNKNTSSQDDADSNQTEKHACTYTPSVTAPTCIKQGFTTYKCSCGRSYVADYTQTTAHSWDKLYCCTKCGNWDKEHAYDFLVELTKMRGKDYGTVINFDIFGNRSSYLSYNKKTNKLSVYTDEMDEDGYCISSLDLSSFFYGSTLFDGELEVTGFLNPKTFTAYAPLPDVHYTGQANLKLQVVDYARVATNALIIAVQTVLEQSTDGQLTLKDIGLIAY